MVTTPVVTSVAVPFGPPSFTLATVDSGLVTVSASLTVTDPHTRVRRNGLHTPFHE